MADDSTALDEVDREILHYLQSDARNTTNADISEEVGVSATTVGQRISDLQDEGVIQTFHTMVDYEAGGFPHRLLVFCTVDPADRHEAADALLEQHGVISVRELITGECNMHVEVVGRSRQEVVETIGAIGDHGVDVVDSEMVKNEIRRPFDDFRPDDEE